MQFEITELNRRLANMVMIGRVIETDFSEDVPKVQIRIGDLTTAWLPMLTQRAGNDVSWWPLEEGEQVLVLSPSGDPAQGVVLGSINQQSKPSISNTADVHRVEYADGAVVMYDRAAHHLEAVLPEGGTVNIVATGGVTITGSVSITGDVTVEGSVSASDHVSDGVRSMADDRGIYNAHTHGGITPGMGDTAPTSSQQ